MEAEHVDVLYHTEICWPSRGKELKRVFELKYQIGKFVARKGKPVLQFSDPEWVIDSGT
jgi:hypothetical protein